ncbi:hypothetical protein TNCV_1585921 [Trichonephila clavipes]|uniref:Uncharacterized protein n=1 Tax=Trichonephila clavipes TaxID=2585209 RepID=A0A8X6V712_TRICX|nr:hypothetical protein TNCV_1585921 [Trichonephila clavipes]
MKNFLTMFHELSSDLEKVDHWSPGIKLYLIKPPSSYASSLNDQKQRGTESIVESLSSLQLKPSSGRSGLW